MSDQTPIRSFNFKESLPIEIEILDLDAIHKTPQLFEGQNTANFFQLIWVRSGVLRVDIDFTPVYIYEDETFLICINQVYNFHHETEFDGKLIIFTIDFFNLLELDNHLLHWSDLINPLYFNPKIEVSKKFMYPLLDLVEQQISNEGSFIQPFILQSLLRVLLLEIERILNKTKLIPRAHNDLRIGRKFYEKVGKNYKQHHNVSFYQDALGVSEKILNKEVKEFTGKSPKEYLDGRIILEAKRLLSFGKNLSVKEVGIELGFDEPTNFNKFFKKKTGITPKDFSNSSYES